MSVAFRKQVATELCVWRRCLLRVSNRLLLGTLVVGWGDSDPIQSNKRATATAGLDVVIYVLALWCVRSHHLDGLCYC